MPDYHAVAAADARKYKLPVPVFLAQIGQESGFNPNAKSSAGAQGIAQFIPSTAKSYGLSNPFDPVASLDAAARYDRDLLNRYGTIERALSAYNSGRPDAYKDPSFAGGQTSRYVSSILGRAGGPPAGEARATGAPRGASALSTPTSAPPARAAGPSPFIQALLATTSQILGTNPLPLPSLPAAATSPSPSTPVTLSSPTPLPASATTPRKIALPIRGDIGRENPAFLAEVTAAAKARGAVAIVATSGERSAQHNAAVHGASHSNHLPDAQGFGHALDGYAVLRDGSKVPLGQFLKPNAAAFGLRSGATFNWNGTPDVVHVDDGFNGGR